MFRLRQFLYGAISKLRKTLTEKGRNILPSFDLSQPFYAAPLRKFRGGGIKPPIEEYQEEIIKTNALPADGDYDLDKTFPHPNLVPDAVKNVEEITQLAKDDFFIDGAYSIFSTNYHYIDEIFHNKMADARAALIIASLPLDKEFIIRMKFVAKENNKLVIKDKINPVRVGRKKGNQVVTISNTTRPGALVGIDGIYYNGAYPSTAVIYGLYPIREPDLNNLRPLKEGDLNCVARRIIEYFEGAIRGQKLTPARLKKVLDWEEKVRESGVRIGDISVLEKIIKRPIVLKDIGGEDLYNSGKFQRSGWRKVELIAHNGHAFSSSLTFPRVRTVHIYEDDIWEAIRYALKGQPIAVWLLGGTESGGDPTQFVLQNGRTFKTKAAHNRIKRVCVTFRSEELANKVFSVNHAVSIIAREKNGWQPTPASILEAAQMACVEHGHGGLWNSEYNVGDVMCIDMKSCYPASFQGLGEAAPYFKIFGHPGSRMVRTVINDPLPTDISTGFAEVVEWEFAPDIHPVIPAWYGRHFAEKNGPRPRF